MDWDQLRHDPMESMMKTSSQAELRMKLALLDLIASSYFFTVCAQCCSISWWISIPAHCSDSTVCLWIHRLINILLLIEVLANWIAVRWTAKKNTVAHYTYDRWPLCTVCDIPTPPRCHHCPACTACILRRDHHCFFARTCIGHWNQRHFLPLLFYVAMGCAHSMYFLHTYLSAEYNLTILSRQIYRILPPVSMTEWLLGYTSGTVFLFEISFCMIFFAFMAAVIFGLSNLGLTLAGQTAFEAAKDISRYSHKSVVSNWSLVFGRWGFLQFLWPLPQLEMYNDGVHWHSDLHYV